MPDSSRPPTAFPLTRSAAELSAATEETRSGTPSAASGPLGPVSPGAVSLGTGLLGKTAHHVAAASASVRVAVLIISDTRTPETDTSGQYLLAELRTQGHQVTSYRIVKDDAVEIRAALVAFVREATIVISSGGTGITGRDVTIPVVESLITKPIPGFGELFRMLSYAQVGGAAMLSRAVAGLCRGAVIFALPGSLNAVTTAWEGLLKSELPHLAFEVTRHGQPGVTDLGGARPAGGAAAGNTGTSSKPAATKTPELGRHTPGGGHGG
ncbi:MogA/MoaB family molybdenum cofactor biosynthesis protein [Deinococcus aquatilis]|uniref:MogA/MoaB family molybdenum cofactor biosynthesis protein n=1 Tax=Deinococcus aquatilis TaxID=519440 RepID=UPI0012FBAF11|nr:MogA/MoaB family molybdenum cofactor biosynthesis protein [Deinococcus aquatilis]